jgi:F0F1-type ATP synthase assembly protein I
MGFVASATVATFYQWVTSERAELFALKPTLPGLILTVLLGMFAGPFIVVQKVWAGLKSQELNALPALVGVIIAGMWSVCAGIVYLSLLVSA